MLKVSSKDWRRSGVFIVNFEHISHLFVQFLLLTLDMWMFAGTYQSKDTKNTHHNVFRHCYHHNHSSHCTEIFSPSNACCYIEIGFLYMKVFHSQFRLTRHHSQHVYRTWNVMGYIIYWSYTGIPQHGTCSLKHWRRFEPFVCLLQVQVARSTSILSLQRNI